MNCQRCMGNEEASYRVSSDVLEMNVCPACAVEALRLRLTVERLQSAYVRRVSSSDAAPRFSPPDRPAF
jgi:hypothetical protein